MLSCAVVAGRAGVVGEGQTTQRDRFTVAQILGVELAGLAGEGERLAKHRATDGAADTPTAASLRCVLALARPPRSRVSARPLHHAVERVHIADQHPLRMLNQQAALGQHGNLTRHLLTRRAHTRSNVRVARRG